MYASEQDLQDRIDENPSLFSLIDRLEYCRLPDRLLVERTLSLTRDLYLLDHVVQNTPVFPGVMGLEAIAQAARLLPEEMMVTAMQTVQLYDPVIVLNGCETTMHVSLHREGTAISAGLYSDIDNEHAHLTVQLTVEASRPAPLHDIAELSTAVLKKISRREIYKVLFHGPLFQVCGDALLYKDSGIKISMKAVSGPMLTHVEPLWTIQPLLIELGWQAAGLYDYFNKGRISRPHSIDKIKFYAMAENKAVVQAVAIPAIDDPSTNGSCFTIQLISKDKDLLMEMEGYRTLTLTQV